MPAGVPQPRAVEQDHGARNREVTETMWSSVLSVFPASVVQKSICALSLAKRAERTDVGVSHDPPAMNAWL